MQTYKDISTVASSTDNPYWDIVRTIPGNRIDLKYDHIWSPDCYASFADGNYQFDRHALCGEYAWAIPDPLSLDFIVQHAPMGIVEIGAGTGYWAWQLAQLGIDVVAYDIAPPHISTDNGFHCPRNPQGYGREETRPIFFDVQSGNHLMAAQHPDRALLLCWPPYSNDMAATCLQAYTGNRLIYIGESCGGCTGDDAFFAALECNWEETASHRLVQWWGIHDEITVYERKAGESSWKIVL